VERSDRFSTRPQRVRRRATSCSAERLRPIFCWLANHARQCSGRGGRPPQTGGDGRLMRQPMGYSRTPSDAGQRLALPAHRQSALQTQHHTCGPEARTPKERAKVGDCCQRVRNVRRVTLLLNSPVVECDPKRRTLKNLTAALHLQECRHNHHIVQFTVTVDGVAR
jgi:hypothetical protein